MRQREKIWRKYKTDSTKTAFIKARSKYKQQLRMAKTEIISNKVIECGRNTRKLYSLVNGLVWLTTYNPLPDNRTNNQLGEEFATFFMSKIIKILDDLNNHPKYHPLSNNPPQFDQFEEITEEEVLKMINSMEAKACGHNPVPSLVLKDLAPYIIKEITTIVNVSLREGVIPNKWKIAIIKLLLKKTGLDLIPKNYRPVSNLSFMSKLVERCMKVQFNRHCEDNQLVPVYQSAYRSIHSCKTSLVKLVNDIL